MKTVFNKERLISISFLAIPLCFLMTALVYNFSAGTIHLLGVDPEYAYLFNGIILAHLHPDAYHILHPGTPVQVLIAIVSRVVHLFRPGLPLWEDVMAHPEVYIKATIIAGNIINTVFLYLVGRLVYRNSKNILVSLALQATPFAFLMTLELSRRMMPEMIMLSLASCWIIILVRLIYQNPSLINYKKYSLIFGVLLGLSMATKITFLPYFLLVVIILPDWKLRLRFTITAVLSFFVFAFPVLFDFPRYIHWLTANFIHTGNYGTGDPGIINGAVFLESLKTIIKSSLQLLIPAFILLLLALYHLMKNRKSIAIRIGFGLVALLFFQIVLIAKQYAFYYLTPSLLLCVFTGFMVYYLLGMFENGLIRKLAGGIFIGFIIILFILVLPKMGRQLNELRTLKSVHSNASETLQPFLSGSPKIICPNYYRSSADEYGLFFGLHESGRHSNDIAEVYRKKYPETIMYLPWMNTFFDANKAVTPSEFLKPDMDYTLYIGDFSEEQLEGIRTALNSDSIKYILDFRPLFVYDETKEAVYTFRATPVDGVTGSTRMSYSQ